LPKGYVVNRSLEGTTGPTSGCRRKIGAEALLLERQQAVCGGDKKFLGEREL